MAETTPGKQRIPDIDQGRALNRLSALILMLKPLDRQILLSYLEEMDAAAIAEITGLSRASVATKVHRIKQVLARHFFEEQHHVRNTGRLIRVRSGGVSGMRKSRQPSAEC